MSSPHSAADPEQSLLPKPKLRETTEQLLLVKTPFKISTTTAKSTTSCKPLLLGARASRQNNSSSTKSSLKPQRSSESILTKNGSSKDKAGKYAHISARGERKANWVLFVDTAFCGTIWY